MPLRIYSVNCTANKLVSECLCVCQTWTTHSESTRSGWVTTLNQWQGRSLRRQKRSWTSWCHSRMSWSVACISNHHYHPPFFAYKTYDKIILWTSRTSNVQRPNGFIVLSCIVTKTGVFAEEGPENHLPNCMWYAVWVRVCNCWCTAPLPGDMNCGGGSFAPSHNPTAVYMTFFPNGVIQKFFPGFGDTLFTQD